MSKERPILMSGPMVRAILEGRKTQTRRVVKLPIKDRDFGGEIAGCEINSLLRQGLEWVCPYGQPGDRLWVRETTIIAPKRFATPDDTCIPDSDGDLRYVQYIASQPNTEAAGWYKLKKTPSIFMPRWASRITLEITGVRVERLQEISREDAIGEGVDSSQCPTFQTPNQIEAMVKGFGYAVTVDYVGGYKRLWESINGAGSWNANPWVWVITFKRVEGAE